MNFPKHFISAGGDYTTLEEMVAAPYFRKEFTLEKSFKSAEMLICGLGFYEVYINGKRITKGLLAPYVSNPDDIIYYDKYELCNKLRVGSNVIVVCLGNGLQNNPGGYVWNFDRASFRGAPRVALQIDVVFSDDEELLIDSEHGFKCTDSPIIFDDYRVGEYYDARNEIDGLHSAGYDDNAWKAAQKAETPRGEKRICQAPPIIVTKQIKPVSITALDGGYLYDFGGNYAGVTRLSLRGKVGQKIVLYHGETLKNGSLDMKPMSCDPNGINQKDIYICKGEKAEEWQPLFTYHGFQYVFVEGLSEEQAIPETLTCIVMNSDLHERGSFTCSDEVINKLQEMTRSSDLGNFYYFPTDCPHREKNGWTGDAALSIEHMLLNLNVEDSYREWMRNVCKAQADDGNLPGIIPTYEWGYDIGPAWDCVLTYVPYFIYLYRGNKEVLQENADGIFRYLNFLCKKIQPDGLVYWGLGDWCHVDRAADDYKAPNRVTSSVISMDICEKAAFIFEVLNMPLQKEFAQKLFEQFRSAIRKHLLNLHTMTADGNCQTSQAMTIFYNVFEPAEQQEAFKKLLEMIHKYDDHFDVGVLGARVLFHVLAAHGEIDLALKMITQPSFPSYGWWVVEGATTLWEDFNFPYDNPKPGCEVHSHNHHFWGDISHFFIRHLAGINYNPYQTGNRVDIKPLFAKSLNFTNGYYDAPEGRISSKWERKGAESEAYIVLTLEVPDGISGQIVLPSGYHFENLKCVDTVKSGMYRIIEDV